MTSVSRGPQEAAGAAELELPGLVRDRVKEGRAKAAATRARKAAEAETAEVDPVAKVLVDLPMAHLDRPFDYAVPASMAQEARPGVRVKVRFGPKDVDGFVVARAEASEHTKLQPLKRVVSPEVVLTPQVAALSESVARRYAGPRADVLRLAIPPRHASTEKEPSPASPAAPAFDPAAAAAAWAGHEPATAFLRHLASGGAPRAVWHAAAGTDHADLIAHATAATLASGRGALVVVPDWKDLARLDTAMTKVLGEGQHAVLAADAGPAPRYREFLRVARGAVKVAIGTRAAAFAPVRDLGLVVVWDDGDDLLAEQRSPYPHARDVLLLRAEQEQAAALMGGFARTVEAGFLAETGWAQEIRPTRALARERVSIEITGDTDFDLEKDPLTRASRVPREAHEIVRAALTAGPVLLQTPRRGYAASLACDRCRTPARCSACQGPLQLGGPAAPPTCGWCGHVETAWACTACGGFGLRAPIIGEARTAEEMGRSFAGVRVVTSSAGAVKQTVPGSPAIVVATIGAEPVADGGYAAVLLLDTWLLLGRPDLRTDEEALRRWSNASGLVRPGGRVLVVGDPALPVLQALVRWDQPGFARREAAARQEAHLPPASRLATITGTPGALDDALTLLALPPGAEVLGPVPADPTSTGEPRLRAVVRVPRSLGTQLTEALGELQRVRSARKLDPVRVQVDPPTL
ncbi:primosome assembly protein PriA [Nocardioides luteus]|uniref:Probable replication restart protein PriA n=1 Tax=Nocardioides luteus TaxID=1844 RepID=A0A1J4NB66_9ACTN|nr:primosome assembly protein PriA [Nocardioides luteus]